MVRRRDIGGRVDDVQLGTVSLALTGNFPYKWKQMFYLPYLKDSYPFITSVSNAQLYFIELFM